MQFTAQDKYEGDKDFEAFLIDIEAPITVWEIKAYVLGVVIGLESVAPSWVIEELLLIGTEDEFQFGNKDKAEGFHKRFFTLWNELAESQLSNRMPLLSPAPENLSNEELGYAVHIRQEEINGFLGGLCESGSLNNEKAEKKFTEAIDRLEAIGDDLVIIEDLLIEGENEIDFLRAKGILADSEEIFKESFPIISKTLLKIRTSKQDQNS